jgi:predicted lactoylglutathione lyase
MPTVSPQIFVNLPVHDLPSAKDFYTALGYAINPQFTNEDAACVVLSDTIYVMLLVHPFFRTFTSKDICNTATHTEAILCLSANDRAAVDALVARALQAGGKEPKPVQDLGFMYGRSFTDLDGHHWEVMTMLGAPPQ